LERNSFSFSGMVLNDASRRQVTYIVRGSGRVQVVGIDGTRVVTVV
jgi:hypothetical protein